MRSGPWLISCNIAILLLLGSSIAVRAADAPTVGMVTKVENEAEIVSSGGTSTAATGTVLHMKDELRTGADGRLQVKFRDNSTLTLGENASVVIDRYVFDPDSSVGEAVLNSTAGALRFATGRLQAMREKKINISTPVAMIGVRGTEFVHGPHGAEFCLLLLTQSVLSYGNQVGNVLLRLPGYASCTASSSTAPSSPTKWTAAQIQAFLQGTEFQGAPQKQQRPERRGQNQPTQNAQYAISNPTALVPFAGLGLPLGAMVISTQTNSTKTNSISRQ